MFKAYISSSIANDLFIGNYNSKTWYFRSQESKKHEYINYCVLQTH